MAGQGGKDADEKRYVLAIQTSSAAFRLEAELVEEVLHTSGVLATLEVTREGRG